MTVLVFGSGTTSESDVLPEFRLLERAVNRKGESALLVDGRNWPGDQQVTYGTDDVVAITERFDVADVDGAYFSFFTGVFDPGNPDFSDLLEKNANLALTASSEYGSLFKSIARILADAGATVVPSPGRFDLQHRKPWQLYTLKRDGLPVPDTVFSNDYAEILDFVETHDRTVAKPVTKGSLTRMLTKDDLEKKKGQLGTAPIQVQEYVDGRDVRVYVVDGEIVGAFHYPSDSISWKHDVVNHGEEITIEQVQPSAELKAAAIRSTELLNLGYGAVDVVERDDGSFSILEVNETGRFAAPQEATGVDVAGAIAEYLLQ